MNTRLPIAIEAVTQAGNYLKHNFHTRHETFWKEDKTVLLGEDNQSNAMIFETIHKAFPNDSFLSEESKTDTVSNNIWIVDPLCGSLSYLRGLETWSVSAAYVENGEYHLGIVYVPLLDYLFTSEKGNGAFLNKKRIEPSKTSLLADAFVSLEHGVFTSRKYDVVKLISSIKRVRVGHGSGGELGYVAAGYLDALIKTDQTIEHFSGGRAIAEEAGVEFIDFTGKPAPIYLDKQKKIDYIACNKNLIAQLLNCVISKS